MCALVADDAVALPEGRSAVPARKRPRDRKAQILRAAAEAFAARGYHQVGVNDIAAELGISGPALYRHFPNKYALFAATAEAGARTLLTVTESTGDDLDATLRALIGTTIENRFGGGIYRWEARYLEQADRRRVRVLFGEVNRRVAGPLRALRPELSEADTETLAAGALSVIASITAHHTALAPNRVAAVLRDACWTVLRARLTPPPAGPPVRATPPRGAQRDPAAVLIDAAIRTFGERGYHEASMEDVAAAAGMNASGVYRHFAGKADLLAAALYRASDQLTVATRAALAEAADAADALARLADRYVALSFAQPDLLTVYFAEFGNLSDTERARLRTLQRRHVRDWAQLLAEIRPGGVEAQFRVHAALGLVLDVGRLTRFDNRPANRARVHQLMKSVLLPAAKDGRP